METDRGHSLATIQIDVLRVMASQRGIARIRSAVHSGHRVQQNELGYPEVYTYDIVPFALCRNGYVERIGVTLYRMTEKGCAAIERSWV